MIPKIIHYVWVGKNPKSPLIKECMATWKKKLPDYQFIEWNEDNFDIEENRYVKEAYAAKKWAFVSDYIRLKAINEMGGIYLDTDVRVLDNFDSLLNNRAFIGFENNDYLSAAIFGAEKNHPLMKKLLDYYQDLDFKFDKNDQMAGVNSLSVTEIIRKNYGLALGNFEQELADGLHIYPDGILCNPSKNSKSIHLFTGTWLDSEASVKQKIVTNLKRHIASPRQAGLYQRLFR